jgi:CheY-like chemotaxis protein
MSNIHTPEQRARWVALQKQIGQQLRNYYQGYTATRRIKDDPALRAIPIIAVSSYVEDEKARAAGCDEYVPEPYSPRQLSAKIRQYLS